MDSRKVGVFYFLRKYLQSRTDLTNKTIVDIPAGEGRACEVLKALGASVKAFDLFPEFMKVPGVESHFADMTDKFPIEDNFADMAICQEGIEHINDQLSAMREFNRTLKPNGELLLTTPNISNFVGRLSGLVSEAELLRYLPPSEINGIWFSDNSDKFYLGHYFLIGIQRLRNLTALSGFELEKVIMTGVSRSSVILSPVLYPIIFILSSLQFLKTLSKHGKEETQKKVILQQYKLNISPKILFSKHLLLEFRKCRDVEENIGYLKSFSR